ncbi:hypothetical protein RhiirA4_428419 [Rhizophagus irregularis]|uniref:Uncharacterized protein n=1 Tax=Rhizophagus irregularis TaxID=588596 RepID=A0A2I1HCP8_9GLOM|nr:hypothetical protein RhiirA4_428419 [Rhizophagus irregularis]
MLHNKGPELLEIILLVDVHAPALAEIDLSSGGGVLRKNTLGSLMMAWSCLKITNLVLVVALLVLGNVFYNDGRYSSKIFAGLREYREEYTAPDELPAKYTIAVAIGRGIPPEKIVPIACSAASIGGSELSAGLDLWDFL